jgi:acetyltransferase-like isoleucine patch superfamily enzyme
MSRISDKASVETDKIGKNVTIHPFAVIRQDVVIGDNVVIHPHVVIEPHAVIGAGTEIFPFAYVGKVPKGPGPFPREIVYEQKVVIAENCSIGHASTIYYGAQIGPSCLIGDKASIREKVKIDESCIIGPLANISWAVTIGKGSRVLNQSIVAGNCSIGDDCFISIHVSFTNDNYFGEQGYDESFVQAAKLGNRVRVGAGVIFLPGIRVGDGATIAAGSIVTKDVLAETTVRGQPARVVSKL